MCQGHYAVKLEEVHTSPWHPAACLNPHPVPRSTIIAVPSFTCIDMIHLHGSCVSCKDASSVLCCSVTQDYSMDDSSSAPVWVV